MPVDHKAALDAAKALCLVANKVADMLDDLAYSAEECADKAKNVNLGLLPDGTPVADMLQELKEEKADNARYRLALQQIRNMCDSPHWDSARRWKIRDRCNLELGTPNGPTRDKK
jgi:hypothetical protein